MIIPPFLRKIPSNFAMMQNKFGTKIESLMQNKFCTPIGPSIGPLPIFAMECKLKFAMKQNKF
ncbi:MAG: hypothetical protein DRR00_22235 [Candidatus Parabeggiatoa sp. nov. 3]|nr:MAG: hypothetical protein DRR00_22235 [Gammaproteobacteria bacterium]